MDKYTENIMNFESLKSDLKDKIKNKTDLKEQQEKEYNDITKKIKSIDRYKVFKKNPWVKLLIVIVTIIIVGITYFLIPIMALIMNDFSLGTTIYTIVIIGNSTLILVMFVDALKNSIASYNKLKQNGVKELIKQEQYLREKELELCKSIDSLEHSIEKDSVFLEYLIKNDADNFYQENKEKYESLLEKYLNKRIDYSKVHLNDVLIDIEPVKLRNKVKKLM